MEIFMQLIKKNILIEKYLHPKVLKQFYIRMLTNSANSDGF